MNAEQFSHGVQKLIEVARESGTSDEALITELQHIQAALQDRLRE